REPEGAGHPNIVPYQIFPTPTGYLAVAVYGDHFWPGFCRALELPELVAEPRYATNEARCPHPAPLVAQPGAQRAARDGRAREGPGRRRAPAARLPDQARGGRAGAGAAADAWPAHRRGPLRAAVLRLRPE